MTGVQSSPVQGCFEGQLRCAQLRHAHHRHRHDQMTLQSDRNMLCFCKPKYNAKKPLSIITNFIWDNLLFTCIQAPVVTLESGPARKTKGGPSSAGCAARLCIGVPTPNPSVSSGSLDGNWRAVTIGPGAIAFTRMSLGASCFARGRVKDMMAPFVAAQSTKDQISGYKQGDRIQAKDSPSHDERGIDDARTTLHTGDKFGDCNHLENVGIKGTVVRSIAVNMPSDPTCVVANTHICFDPKTLLMANLFHVRLDEPLVLEVQGYQIDVAAISSAALVSSISCRRWEMHDTFQPFDGKHGCGGPSDAAVATRDEGVLASESVDGDDEARNGEQEKVGQLSTSRVHFSLLLWHGDTVRNRWNTIPARSRVGFQTIYMSDKTNQIHKSHANHRFRKVL